MLSIDLNEKQRVEISLISCLLYVICAVLSGLLLATSLIESYSLYPLTSLIEGYNPRWLWIVLVSASGTSIAVNAFGVFMCFKQMYPHRRHDYVVSMAFCTAMTAGMAVAALACSIVCYLHVVHLDDEFKGGLISSMKRYRDNDNIKRRLDDLQYHFGCCGNTKYTDWFQIAWIADQYVDTSDPDVREQIHPGSGYQSDAVPFSCCNPESRRPCISQSVHDNSKHYNYDYQKQLTLNRVGCRQRLQQHVSAVLLFYIGLPSVGLFVVEIIVFVLARFVQTSVARALKSGEPTAAAKGFVFLWGLSNNTVDDKCQQRPPSATPSHVAPNSSVPPTPAASKSIASAATSHTGSLAPSISSSLRPPAAATPSNTSVNMTHHNVNQVANADSSYDDDADLLLDAESIVSRVGSTPHQLADNSHHEVVREPAATNFLSDHRSRDSPSWPPPRGDLLYNGHRVQSTDSKVFAETRSALSRVQNSQSMRPSTTINARQQQQQRQNNQQQPSSSTRSLNTQRRSSEVQQPRQQQQQQQQQQRPSNGPVRPAALIQSPVVAVSSNLLHVSASSSRGPPTSTAMYGAVDEVQQMQAHRQSKVGRGRRFVADQRQSLSQHEQQRRQEHHVVARSRTRDALQQSSQRRV